MIVGPLSQTTNGSKKRSQPCLPIEHRHHLRQFPAGKGRVERAFGTLQDRLVKELRLAGGSSIAAANEWLPNFITDYNDRFGRPPLNSKPLHRPLSVGEDLDEILAWREARTVTQNLTLHYDRMMLLLEPTPFAKWLGAQEGQVV